MKLVCRFIALLLCLVACACSAKKSGYKGGQAGTRPYTIAGKTYYPLKSAHGYVEEGMASWYGPGFHGKTTANGETYNQYAMTAAHKVLPLGTKVRVTRLDNGRSILVRINDRGPFVDNRVIDLSRAAATRLEMMGTGTTKVRVQSVGEIAQASASGDIQGEFYIQAGAFGQKENARKLIATLSAEGRKGRLIFGSNNMWNVQIGPWNDLDAARQQLAPIKAIYPHAFVVGGK